MHPAGIVMHDVYPRLKVSGLAFMVDEFTTIITYDGMYPVFYGVMSRVTLTQLAPRSTRQICIGRLNSRLIITDNKINTCATISLLKESR